MLAQLPQAIRHIVFRWKAPGMVSLQSSSTLIQPTESTYCRVDWEAISLASFQRGVVSIEPRLFSSYVDFRRSWLRAAPTHVVTAHKQTATFELGLPFFFFPEQSWKPSRLEAETNTGRAQKHNLLEFRNTAGQRTLHSVNEIVLICGQMSNATLAKTS